MTVIQSLKVPADDFLSATEIKLKKAKRLFVLFYRAPIFLPGLLYLLIKEMDTST
jgi:hypothetical protein